MNNDITTLLTDIHKYLDGNVNLIEEYIGYDSEGRDYVTRVIDIKCRNADVSYIVKNKIYSIIENFIVERLGTHDVLIRNIQCDCKETSTYELKCTLTVYDDTAGTLPMIGPTKTKMMARHLERHVIPSSSDNEYCNVVYAGAPEAIDESVKYHGIIRLNIRMNLRDSCYRNLINSIILDLRECGLSIDRDYEFNVTDIDIDSIYSSNIFVIYTLQICFK